VLRKRLQRLLDLVDGAVGVEPLNPLLQLARRLRAAEHQHREQRQLRRHPSERVVEQVPVLRDAAARTARQPDPAAAGEPLERGADRRFVVVDDGIPIRRLVAGQPERIQRERVLVGRRPLLLDERPEHPDFGGVQVHAAEP
jgi:hypothetical protein